MAKDLQTIRMDRANRMADALKAETDRERACVGDALLDDCSRKCFRSGSPDQESEIEEVLGDGTLVPEHDPYDNFRNAFLTVDLWWTSVWQHSSRTKSRTCARGSVRSIIPTKVNDRRYNSTSCAVSTTARGA
jgi:hypothetical protein